MSAISGLGSSQAWSAVISQRGARPPGDADAASFKDKLFNKVDADGSGGVDATELQALTSAIEKATGQSLGKVDVSALDSNGDGSVNASELDSGLKKLLGGGDTVSFARARGADGGGDLEKQVIAQADSDGNGSVDLAELKKTLASVASADGSTPSDADIEAAFKKLDSDGSGGITASELEAARPSGPPPGPPPGDNTQAGSSTASSGHAAAVGHAGGTGGASSASSSSSSTSDPADANGDGTVTQQEQAAYDAKQALKALFSGSSDSSDSSTSSTDSSSKAKAKAVDYDALAEQVLRHYAQGAADAASSQASVGSALSVAA